MNNLNIIFLLAWVNENEKKNDYFFELQLNFTYCYFTKSIVVTFIHSFR